MAIWRKVYVKMWGDAKVRALSRPQPCGQVLWFHMIAGEQTGILPGLFRIGEQAFAEQLCWPLDAFRDAMREVIREGLAEASWQDRLVWVPNAIKYNAPGAPNAVKSWRDAWEELPECALKLKAWRALNAFMDGMSDAFRDAFREACPMPCGIQEQEQEQEDTHDRITSVGTHSASAQKTEPMALECGSEPETSAQPPTAEATTLGTSATHPAPAEGDLQAEICLHRPPLTLQAVQGEAQTNLAIPGRPDVGDRAVAGMCVLRATKKTDPPEPEIEEIIKIWDQVCVPAGFAKAHRTPQQRKKARTRLREPGWLSCFEEACIYAASEPFYRGGSSSGWVMTFGWLLEPGRAERLAEQADTRKRRDPERTHSSGCQAWDKVLDTARKEGLGGLVARWWSRLNAKTEGQTITLSSTDPYTVGFVGQKHLATLERLAAKCGFSIRIIAGLELET